MSAFGKLRRYLTLPARSASRIARDVDDEIRLHLDLRTEELLRLGVPAAEARARAARQFGDLDDATRYCVAVDRHAERRRRAFTWWSELAQDAGHTLRTLRRAPAFNAATVVTLAVALGARAAPGAGRVGAYRVAVRRHRHVRPGWFHPRRRALRGQRHRLLGLRG